MSGGIALFLKPALRAKIMQETGKWIYNDTVDGSDILHHPGVYNKSVNGIH